MTAHLNTFISLIQKETSELERLSVILQEERALLSQPNPEILLPHNDRKEALLKKIEIHDQERDELLTTGGFESNKAGLEAFLEAHNASQATFDPLFKHFLILVKECSHLNQINNAIVQSRLRYTQQTIAILHGQEFSFNQYDKNGVSAQKGQGRSLASA